MCIPSPRETPKTATHSFSLSSLLQSQRQECNATQRNATKPLIAKLAKALHGPANHTHSTKTPPPTPRPCDITIQTASCVRAPPRWPSRLRARPTTRQQPTAQRPQEPSSPLPALLLSALHARNERGERSTQWPAAPPAKKKKANEYTLCMYVCKDGRALATLPSLAGGRVVGFGGGAAASGEGCSKGQGENKGNHSVGGWMSE